MISHFCRVVKVFHRNLATLSKLANFRLHEEFQEFFDITNQMTPLSRAPLVGECHCHRSNFLCPLLLLLTSSLILSILFQCLLCTHCFPWFLPLRCSILNHLSIYCFLPFPPSCHSQNIKLGTKPETQNHIN